MITGCNKNSKVLVPQLKYNMKRSSTNLRAAAGLNSFQFSVGSLLKVIIDTSFL